MSAAAWAVIIKPFLLLAIATIKARYAKWR